MEAYDGGVHYPAEYPPPRWEAKWVETGKVWYLGQHMVYDLYMYRPDNHDSSVMPYHGYFFYIHAEDGDYWNQLTIEDEDNRADRTPERVDALKACMVRALAEGLVS